MLNRNDYIVVFITASSPEEARLLEEKLVDGELAACVNSVPVDSCFMWKQKKETAKEILLIVKSRRKLFKKLEETVKQYHSYEIPEIIALPIIAGNPEYLNWVKENTA